MPRYTDQQLLSAANGSRSVREVLGKLRIRLTGGSQNHIKLRLQKCGFDTTSMLGKASNYGCVSKSRKSPDQILILREYGSRTKASQLRRALIESGIVYECCFCKTGPKWYGKAMTLEVDHINENWLDDTKENLRFLCPNCHASRD